MKINGKRLLLILLIICIILLCIVGIITIITSIIVKYYKPAIEYTWLNSLAPCGKEMCPSSIKELSPIPLQNYSLYNKTVARYCADLITRVNLAVNNKPLPPKGLTEELKIYNNKKDPIFGTLWSSNNKKIAWLAFRGTDELIREWIQDFQYFENSYKKPTQNSLANLTFLKTNFLENDITSLPSVHQGFLDIYMKIRDELITKLKDLQPTHLIVTGHSLGGAIAIIAGLDLALTYSKLNLVVYTFASPRVGNIDFANLINNSNLKLFRVVNTVDIVPTLPLAVCPNLKQFHSPFIYMDAGVLKTFTSNWLSIANNHMLANYIEHIPDN